MMPKRSSHPGARACGIQDTGADIEQFLVLFHQAILENDLPTITNMYESGWNRLTQVCSVLLAGETVLIV